MTVLDQIRALVLRDEAEVQPGCPAETLGVYVTSARRRGDQWQRLIELRQRTRLRRRA